MCVCVCVVSVCCVSVCKMKFSTSASSLQQERAGEHSQKSALQTFSMVNLATVLSFEDFCTC